MIQVIVQIIDELTGGGAQRSTLKIAKGFSTRGHDVHLISVRNIEPEYPIEFKHTYYTLDYSNIFLKNYIYANKLSKLLIDIERNSGSIGLILGNLGLSHTLMSIVGLPGAYYTIRNTLSTSKLNVRSGFSKYIKRKKIKNFYKNKNLISVSSGVREDLIEKFQITPINNLVIYNPFDFHEIRELSIQSKNEYCNEDYIIHVGRFVDAKRHDILLKAFAKSNLSFKLLLLGKGENEESIRKLAIDLNIEKKVIFAGFKSNPYPYIKDAKMMVLSSDFEGLPTVLIEALALNTAIVSTNCTSGAKEILTHKLEAYLSPVGNVELLAKNIQKMSNNLLSDFEEELKPFQMDNVIEQYLKLCT